MRAAGTLARVHGPHRPQLVHVTLGEEFDHVQCIRERDDHQRHSQCVEDIGRDHSLHLQDTRHEQTSSAHAMPAT
jgi:hypothetical protein